MTASPKLSKWFYDSAQRNCRLAPRTVRPPPETDAAPEAAPAPPKRRGFAPGQPQKRFTDPQRQTIIDLIAQHPRSPSTVRRKFAEAWPRLTVITVGLRNIKLKAIAAGKLAL